MGCLFIVVILVILNTNKFVSSPSTGIGIQKSSLRSATNQYSSNHENLDLINPDPVALGGVTDLDQWLNRVVSGAHRVVHNIIHETATTETISFVQSSTPVISSEKEIKSEMPHLTQEEILKRLNLVSFNTDTNSSNQQPSTIKSQIQIHTVTYASHGGKDDRFCRAIESAIRSGIDLTILGWDTPWIGLSQKLEAALSYVRTLPPNDIFMFTDAFDVLFADSSESIKNKFLKLSKILSSRIIFAAECGCWPHIMEDMNEDKTDIRHKPSSFCFGKYPLSPTPYRYLNSGTWIGYVDSSVKMLEQVIKEAGNDFKNANDQKLVADMYMSGEHGIKLDFYNKLFQSVHMTSHPLTDCNPIQHLKLSSNKIWENKLTKSIPSVIHFNGGGKLHHLDMESKVWYKALQYNTPEIKQALSDYLIHVPNQINGRIRFGSICKEYFTT